MATRSTSPDGDPARDPRRTEVETVETRDDGAVAGRLEEIWKRAYSARTRDDLEDLYEDWSETYDEDHEHIGFIGHRVAAEVLSRYVTRRDVARVVDAGAGTGAAGEALAALGFRDMVALDLSAAMLEKARAKGLYRQLLVADLSHPVDTFAQDTFDAAILVGVFSYGQAPAEALDEIVRLVRPGGAVAFTMREDFHRDNAMGVRARMEALERQGAWTLIERSDAHPYLPKKDPDATFRVWCYRVTGTTEAEVEDGFEDAVREAFEGDDDVKELDHAWIWDSTASRLYERYTRTAGYYLTDCEEEILRTHAADIWQGERVLVELGCGSARKIKHVLAACFAKPDGRPLRYVPIDVSRGALRATVGEVKQLHPEGLEVEPRQGLYEDALQDLPEDERKLVFFFGSSIGNLATVEATIGFLEGLRAKLHAGDRLVIGIDLHKDRRVFDRAYNESEACRTFFVHMIRRINEHMGADFDPRMFKLGSTYVEEPPHRGIRTRRVNLRIVPKRRQGSWVPRLGREVELQPGQAVQVGVSRKFEPEAIREMARPAGFRLGRQWFDHKRWFSLNEMIAADAPGR